MAALLWLAANITMVVFIIKTVKEKDTEQKKKTRKIWLISLAVAVVMFFVVAATGSKSKQENGEETTPTEATTATEAPTEASNDATVEPTEASQPTEIAEPKESDSSNQDDVSTVELIAGELGEYGQELVLNVGTEFEDKTIGYFVPAGIYEVTNIGDKRTQVNVYKNEKNVIDGWEEWADSKVELLDPNETKEMTVEDGYFFNIDAPSHISIKQVGDVTSAGSAEFGEDKEALREAFNSSLGDTKPLWYDNVRNDVTGNWRELVVYTNKEFDGQMAIDYANAYIESDTEVHFVVNLYAKTTTCISRMGNLLFVTVKEYKDGEEHDAKELGGGNVLKNFSVDIDTGEVEVF